MEEVRKALTGLTALCLAASFGVAQAGAADPDAPAADAAPVRYLGYSGTAVARHTNKFLYREQHVLSLKEGRLAERVVLYLCSDGSAFARKTASYENALAPDFDLEDSSTGMGEGVRTVGTTRTVFYRANRVDAEKSGALPAVSGLVADTGFDEFIHTHWSQLLQSNSVNLHFLVPSRLDELSFQVEHVRSDAINGTAVEVFRLHLAGIIGWVIPGIDVSYGAVSHVLMRYDGVSDLHDAAGDNFQAQIDFPESERRPTDEAADSSARRAHLAPCH